MIRVFLLFLILVSHTVLACEVIDDAGQTIHLNHPAQRIISLAPDITEIVFSIGAGKNIVGVMRGSDYPLQAKKIPIVASYNNVDTEAILALHPDLIIRWSDDHASEQLKKLAIPVYVSHQKNILDIPETMRRLGCLTGTEKNAEKTATQFFQQYQKIKSKYSHKKTVTVFYQVWPKPLMTITKTSWINEVITLCGGKNIFENLHGAAPQVSLESVIVANPDVIIGSHVENWQRKHVYQIDTDLIERAGPRLLNGVENLCMLLDDARNDITRR
jgi:iron complex transport system substrate-binding protein